MWFTHPPSAPAVESYGRFGRGSALYFIRPSYDSPTAHFHVRYGHIGDRVADNLNVIGQIVDDERREIDSHVTKILWIRGGAVEKLQHDATTRSTGGRPALLRSWKVNEELVTEFRNRFAAQVSWIEEFKRFEKDFWNREAGFDLAYNTREYQSVKTGVKMGRNFDADFVLWTAAARYKVTANLSAEYSLERLELDPDPQRQSTWPSSTNSVHGRPLAVSGGKKMRIISERADTQSDCRIDQRKSSPALQGVVPLQVAFDFRWRLV